MTTPITLYSSSSCSDCRKLKAQLDLLGIVYLEKNIEEDSEALNFLLEKTNGKKITPLLDIGGKILIDPHPKELAKELQL